VRKDRTLVVAVSAEGKGEAMRDLTQKRLRAMGDALRGAGFSFEQRRLGEGQAAREVLLSDLRGDRPDLVFCSFYDRGVYEALAKEDLLVVGSSAEALELTLSKSSLKRAWEAEGISSPSGFCVRRTGTGAIAGRRLVGKARDYPYIVKPNAEDEHRGIHARSIAFDAGSLVASIDSALEEYDELIVEHFVGGASSREYTVAMIGNGEGALMLPAEISLKARRPIRVVTGVDRERGLAVAAPVLDASSCRIGSFARRAIEVSGARDYARCDIIEEAGRLFALEVNGQPRIPDPWFEACASGAGLEGNKYIVAIALAALRRGAGAGFFGKDLPSNDALMLPGPAYERLSS
jgi:D-alanine-D-alanine ligase-like ATP-grasp enzyme